MSALARSLSTALYGRRGLALALLLAPPLLWLGIVYCGSLLALLANSFYGLDEFSGVIKREFTLRNFVELAAPANRDVIARTVGMAAAVTVGCALVAFPIAYLMARYTRGWVRAARGFFGRIPGIICMFATRPVGVRD